MLGIKWRTQDVESSNNCYIKCYRILYSR